MNISNTAATSDEPLIRARRLLAEGAFAESIRLYESLLETEPQQIEALNAVGMWAVRGGNLERGLSLLERAAAAAPDDPLTLNNLGQLYQAAGDPHKATASYRRLLLNKPDAYVARLSLARLLEEQGQVQQALPIYFRAVTDAQRDGRWLSADSTPRALQTLVQHAMRTIDAGRHQLFGRILETWRQRYGESELRRVQACLQIYLGDVAAQYPDPRQQPTFLFFPGLTAMPYLDKRLVPETGALEDAWQMVREELAVLLTGEQGRERVFHSDELERANLRGERGLPSWNGYYFHRHGELREDNRRACPRTAELLDNLPLCRIREHAPETLFSVLAPGTHLLPHRGITNTRVVGHLALIVPPDCALKVADQEYAWREGEVVLFDDTYLHEAWNRSEQLRVVLIFDLWNPQLSGAERIMVTEMVEAIGEFRAAGDVV